jgi:pimeloyl-ACP methyl ester carboxylesterase
VNVHGEKIMLPRVGIPIVLLVAALASGCESGTSRGPEAIEFTAPPPPTGQGFVALYAPPVDVVPYPNDLYNPDGTRLGVPVRLTSPLAGGLNTLDGFSTTAPIGASFNGPVAPESLVPFDPTGAPTGAESLFVIDVTNGVPLVPGLHYEVRVSEAAGTGGGLVEIAPLLPLAPRTRYAFLITDNVENTFGVAAEADTIFAAVRDTHLAGADSVPGAPQLDPLFPAITPLIDLAEQLGLAGGSVIAAWSLLTQSIEDVLETLAQNATARPAVVAPAGISTADLGLGLPGLADIYVGFMEVPYYGDPATPLDSFWITAELMPPDGANPQPIPRVPDMRIPLLVSLPNDTSSEQKPAEGWPVALFQHGVTSNRAAMLALADAFAQAGIAVIAIDLPLHGVTDTASPFYQGPDSPFGNNERHFNMDNVGATGVFMPDGEIDNGWQILNLQNPLNARDHIRQAVSDMVHLVRTIPTLDLPDGLAGPDLDGNRIHFVGVSLGGIISGVFLGLAPEIATATLANPAGPWTSILTDAEAVTFGQPIRDGLAGQGLPQGTVGFDNFVRDLQTLIDPVDPVNYATAAAANQPLHVLSVADDQTVPNAPTDNLVSLWGLPTISSTVHSAPETVSGMVRFTSGGHASLLDPSVDPAVTMEMQQQTVAFAASLGTLILIGDENLVE